LALGQLPPNGGQQKGVPSAAPISWRKSWPTQSPTYITIQRRGRAGQVVVRRNHSHHANVNIDLENERASACECSRGHSPPFPAGRDRRETCAPEGSKGDCPIRVLIGTEGGGLATGAAN